MKKSGLFKGISAILKLTIFGFLIPFTLAACGDGGGNGNTAPSAAPPAVALSSAKALTAYSLAGVSGTIDEGTKTIAVIVPFGTDVTALVAAFTTTGVNAAVGAAVQISGVTANDFTNPVIYTVTAADGTTADYAVTVTVAPSSAKGITAYSLASISGTIDETAKTIAVIMPFGTDVTALVAAFTTTGVNAAVGAAVQISGVTANDFTNPVIYTVTAADGTTADYAVTATVETSAVSAVKLPKTGQTTSYAAGDDGGLQRGVAWPDPRFTVGIGDEADCITDNLTGLMWLKSPDTVLRKWWPALEYVTHLTYCGFNDWRMPNRRELLSIINQSQPDNISWLHSQGFSNLLYDDIHYWSSTTCAHDRARAWFVSIWAGFTSDADKATSHRYLWPVRSGR